MALGSEHRLVRAPERLSVGPWFEPRSGSQKIQGVTSPGVAPLSFYTERQRHSLASDASGDVKAAPRPVLAHSRSAIVLTTAAASAGMLMALMGTERSGSVARWARTNTENLGFH